MFSVRFTTAMFLIMDYVTTLEIEVLPNGAHLDAGDGSRELLRRENIDLTLPIETASHPEIQQPSAKSFIDKDNDAASWFHVGLDTQLVCEGGQPNYPNIIGSDTFSLREVLWLMKHSELMQSDVADSLLNSHQKTDSTAWKLMLSGWLVTQHKNCFNHTVCLLLSRKMLHASERDGACSTSSLLSQAHKELQFGREAELADHGQGSSVGIVPQALKQLTMYVLEDAMNDAVRPGSRQRNTSSLLKSNYSMASIGNFTAGVTHTARRTDTNSSIMLPMQWYILATQHRDNLLKGLNSSDADLALLTRTFLLAAQNYAGSERVHSMLLFLLRLLAEQEELSSPDLLARVAVVVNFYESRVRKLEGLFRNADAADHPLKDMQSHIDQLLAHLEQMSQDHKNALPGDVGALPAFWAGRLEKLRRHLQDHLLGRASPQQTVLLWTCSFGTGHQGAAKAIRQYLSEYNVVIVDPTKDKEFYEDDIFGNFMRAYIMSDWDKTYMFNHWVLRNKQYLFENAIESFQRLTGWLTRGDSTRFAPPCIAPECDAMQKKFLRRALLRTAPDFVITVYHHDLISILELCEEHRNLPIMHLATDMDSKMSEVFGVEPTYSHFQVGLPFKLFESYQTIPPLNIKQTFVSGFPVREPFLAPLPSREELEKERLARRLPSGAKVVLVMSGGYGQAVPWLKPLADSPTWQQPPLHVIVVLGSNTAYKAELEKYFNDKKQVEDHLIYFGSNQNITFEIAKDPSSTSKNNNETTVTGRELSILMDLADVLITKPGGSTTAEAAYRGVPLLFDAIDGLLKWEAFTARVFVKHKRGILLESPEDLETAIEQVVNLGRSQALVVDDSGLKVGEVFNTSHIIYRKMLEMMAAVSEPAGLM